MTKTRIGIDGFGRMGRLALRAEWGYANRLAESARAVGPSLPAGAGLRSAE